MKKNTGWHWLSFLSAMVCLLCGIVFLMPTQEVRAQETYAIEYGVYRDTNVNEIQDGAEPNVEGHFAQLLDSSGTVVLQEVYTGPWGGWFFNVPSGDYWVRLLINPAQEFITSYQLADVPVRVEGGDVLLRGSQAFGLAPHPAYVVNLDLSQIPEHGNWSDTDGVQHLPGSTVSNGQVVYQPVEIGSGWDDVDQIANSGTFDQYFCPYNGSFGMHTRWSQQRYIPDLAKFTKIGWQLVHANWANEQFHLLFTEFAALSELLWCGSPGEAPDFVMAQNPGLIPAHVDINETGKQFVPGKVSDGGNGFRTEPVEITAMADDYVERMDSGVVRQWACTLDQSESDWLTVYAPLQYLQQWPEINVQQLLELGHVELGEELAYNFFKLNWEVYIVYTKPVDCQIQQSVPTPTPTATEVPTEVPTATPTNVPTMTPTATLVPTQVPTATWVPTQMPTATPTSTEVPTNVPTATPTATWVPTQVPTVMPTATEVPTEVPTAMPTATEVPTEVPTEEPVAIIGAKIYFDANNNCIFDIGEPLLVGAEVFLNGNRGDRQTQGSWDADTIQFTVQPGVLHRLEVDLETVSPYLEPVCPNPAVLEYAPQAGEEYYQMYFGFQLVALDCEFVANLDDPNVIRWVVQEDPKYVAKPLGNHETAHGVDVVTQLIAAPQFTVWVQCFCPDDGGPGTQTIFVAFNRHPGEEYTRPFDQEISDQQPFTVLQPEIYFGLQGFEWVFAVNSENTTCPEPTPEPTETPEPTPEPTETPQPPNRCGSGAGDHGTCLPLVIHQHLPTGGGGDTTPTPMPQAICPAQTMAVYLGDSQTSVAVREYMEGQAAPTYTLRILNKDKAISFVSSRYPLSKVDLYRVSEGEYKYLREGWLERPTRFNTVEEEGSFLLELRLTYAVYFEFKEDGKSCSVAFIFLWDPPEDVMTAAGVGWPPEAVAILEEGGRTYWISESGMLHVVE